MKFIKCEQLTERLYSHVLDLLISSPGHNLRWVLFFFWYYFSSARKWTNCAIVPMMPWQPTHALFPWQLKRSLEERSDRDFSRMLIAMSVKPTLTDELLKVNSGTILIVPEEGWFGQPKYSTPTKKSFYVVSTSASIFFIFFKCTLLIYPEDFSNLWKLITTIKLNTAAKAPWARVHPGDRV